ncbi:MAG: peptidyl-prolyl cis-trans isomerase [Candidatus Brocadiia bacterium]|nr:MAG: peptidyl-prolyl cis-trans isomerase [Candidatus Brocadiia bacterium]
MKIRVFILILAVLLAGGGVSSAVNPQVTLQITGAVSGTIVLELNQDKAPITTDNFINYVKAGFYDGLIFHRVIKDFMIQGGGYDVNYIERPTGPAITTESSNGLSNVRGTIAMARTPWPYSATSQFFINQKDNLFLDYGPVYFDANDEPLIKVGYCVFGEVISGMNVVDAIAVLPVNTEKRPLSNVIIQSATVTLDVPVCPEKLPGDINGDCIVNLKDYAELANDFAGMTGNWLKSN